jgi:peptidyl-prolyl cis-trans isomerase C
MIRSPGAVALLALLLATTACGNKATGQTVAVVNGEEISLSELNAELAAANVPDTADKKTVLPRLLQRIVDRRLLAQRAAEQGVDRTPEYLARQRRLNEDLLIGLYSKRQFDSIRVPDPKAIDEFIAANPGMFQQRSVLSLDQLQFDMPADPTILNRLKDDHSLEAVAKSLTELGIPFQRGKSKLDTATLPAAMLGQINSLPAGEPFVVPAGGKAIVSVVTARETANVAPEENRKLAAQAIRQKKLQELLDQQLKELRSSGKVEYQPGYEPPAPTPASKQATPKQPKKS